MVEPIKAKVEPISFKFELNNMDRAISFPPGSLLLLLSQNSMFRKNWERRLFGNTPRFWGLFWWSEEAVMLGGGVPYGTSSPDLD